MLPPELADYSKHIRSADDFLSSHFVYFLTSGSSIVYVGKTRNLVSRIRSHERSAACDFDGVFCLQVKTGHQASVIEEAFISELRPAGNKVVPLESDRLRAVLIDIKSNPACIRDVFPSGRRSLYS